MFVTGAAGGLGEAAVERFVAAGWLVAAADLTAPAGGSRHGVLDLELDITDDASLEAAMRHVAQWAPEGLDALVTFAAVGGIGPLMDTSPDALTRVLDVNLVGTHRTVLAAWTLLRRRGGRVILIGSEAGAQYAMPLNGPYAMSKHAMEAYADALRRELMFVDVPVVLMQPGPFRTEMLSRVPEVFSAVPDDSAFKHLATAAVALVGGEERRASDPSVLAEAVLHAATTSRPRARYPVAVDRRRALLDRLPVGLVDRLIRLAIR